MLNNVIPLWPQGAPEPDKVKSEEQPRLVLHLLPEGEPKSVVIVCPGGGYHIRAEHEAGPIAAMFNAAGIAAAVLHYRVAPHRHPVPLMDAQRAIRLVRSNAQAWNLRPDKVTILGFSAGGHLASTAATHFDAGNSDDDDPIEHNSSRPDAAILCYPVISFGEFRHTGSMHNLLGENPDEELRLSLSNELQVTSRTPPCFIWHTADDAGVPVENSLLFAQALFRNQVSFELHVFPQGRHGLGLAEDTPGADQWPGLCVKWLKGLEEISSEASPQTGKV